MATSAAEPAQRMIGILGGTFDPVHYGHLRLGLEAREAFDLAAVHLVPCATPPHRGTPGAAPEDRRAMLERAVAGHPDFVVDTVEFERPGPSYMADTLRILRERLARPLCLILGADAFAGLAGWHRWRELFRWAHIAVMERPGATRDWPDQLAREVAERHTEFRAGRAAEAGCLFFDRGAQLDIASSHIRTLIRQGRDPRFLLPDGVLAYVRDHRLYR